MAKVEFEGTVAGKEIKGEFTIFGATASVEGTPISAEEAAKIAARPSFYDLYEARAQQGIRDVFFLRLEQLYPFPRQALIEELGQLQRLWVARGRDRGYAGSGPSGFAASS